MKNHITDLCALLWAMHTPESRDNQDLGSALTELHKLVCKKTQADDIQVKINSILKAYTFLETHYAACQQALAQQRDNGWWHALTVDVNITRNQPPPKNTPIQTYRNKGDEIDNIAVEIADHLKNCYSPDNEEKGNALKVINSLKAHLKL